MPGLNLSFLGSLQVTLNDTAITSLLWAKHIALLVYLSVEADQPHRREVLAGLLWPDQSETAARHSLRQAFYQLHQAFGELFSQYLVVDSQAAQFNQAGDYSLDVMDFTSSIEQSHKHEHLRLETCRPCIERMQKSASLYRGEFLEGFFLKDSFLFEEWALIKRDRLARMALSAFHTLAEHYKLRGEYSLMEQAARRQIEINPFYESAHRRVMEALVWSGNKTAALAHFETLKRMLSEELNASPERRTIALQTQIKGRKSVPRNPAPLYNWNEPLTSFVGRSQEINQIIEQLQNPRVRLLTLVGPGGIGKTRLALKAVADEAYSFRDGACFVPLEPLSSPEYILPAIADALEIPLNDQMELADQLLGYLRRKELILVLDNLEHLTPARGFVIELLYTCPSVKVVVTTRASLNIQEEWLFPVKGLAVPENETPTNLEAFDAVNLFLQRARQVRPDIIFQETDRLAIAQICQSVDGMPLALELAASWVKLLSCNEIAQEITRNWGFLSTNILELPERHRSLQTVLDHSWNLLNQAEQRALRHIAVFRGGFTRQAAEQAAGVNLNVLSELVNKSLLKFTRMDRFDLHPLIQKYAEEKLAKLPEERRIIEDQYGMFYAEFIRYQGERLKGPAQIEALAKFDLEIENVRKAWQWITDGVHLAEIEQCLEGIGIYFRTKGRYQEGARAYEQAVYAIRSRETSTIQPFFRTDAILGISQVGQGVCCLHLGQPLQAYQLIYEGLGLLRPTGLPKELAHALTWLGVVTIFFGEYQQAITFTQEGLMYARRSCDQWTIGTALLCSGHALRPVDFVEAGKYYQESTEHFRAIGDRRTLATAIYFLGEIQRHMGNYYEAKLYLEESLELAKETGSSSFEARSMESLAEVAFSSSRYIEARQLLESSLETLKTIGERRVILTGLACLGAVMYRLGEPLIAKEYYQEAIRKGLEMQATPLLLGCLIYMAEPLIDEGVPKIKLATEILGFVQQHPATWQEDKVRADQLLTRLKAELPLDEYQTLIQKGSTDTITNLAGSVSQLLEEMQK